MKESMRGIISAYYQIMQQKSFNLEPWNYDDPIVPLSHRHKLQALQGPSEKNESARIKKPIKLYLHQRNLQTIQFQDRSSFLSLRLKKKIFRTEQSSRNISPAIKQKSLFQKHDSKYEEININNKEANMKYFRNIVSIVEKKAVKKQKSPRFVLQSGKKDVIIFPKAKKPSHQVMNRLKSIQLKAKQYSLDKKGRNKLIKKINPLKEELSINLKTFFLKTMHGRLEQGSPRVRVKEHDIRLKNMLEKSNRRKRQMEELFKSRIIIGKKELERRRGNIKIEELFLTERIKTSEEIESIKIDELFLTNGKDQFSDVAICGPVSRKQGKSNHRIRFKTQQ